MEKLRRNCAETAEFVDKFKSGDAEAFNLFCKEYRKYVILSIKNKCKRCDIDDIAQDALLKAFKSRANYDPTKSKLSTWVSRLSASVAIDAYRSKKTKIKICEVVEFDKPASIESDKKETIQFIVSRMSSDDIILARLRFLEGMRYEDISEILNIPVGSVKSSVFRLKQRITDWHSNAR